MSSSTTAVGYEGDTGRGLSLPVAASSPGLVAIGDVPDEDDDDIEYEPPSEQSDLSVETSEEVDEDEDEEDDEGDDEGGHGDGDFFDAQDTMDGVEIEFSVGNEDNIRDERRGDNEVEETNQTTQRNTETIRMTPTQLLAVLQSNAPFRQLYLRQLSRGRSVSNRDSGADAEDGSIDVEALPYGDSRSRQRRNPKKRENRFPETPSEEGKALMRSGIYGARDDFSDLRRHRKNDLNKRLMWRRLGVQPRGSYGRANRLISQNMVPSTSVADKIVHYDSRAYSGQFSEDGNFFFSCTQDFKVRMYDTSNPYEWKYYKTVEYPFGQWTITDASLSPDNRWLAYSSIRHLVSLASTDPSDSSDPAVLNFATPSAAGRRTTSIWERAGFGIWSLRFSGDGREIVAGTSDHSVVVYDLETQRSILRLANHEDDVNAVCFGDSSSPHILYSGSDDQTIRVWDRRSMGDGREAGIFVGHTEGLTYVDSKGDGRYVLSNGKDQMTKLWDLRKMISPSEFKLMDLRRFTTNFDYRVSFYDPADYEPNPDDCSVVTFRGHRVLKTLIRCHFSPPGSTNSAYIYSGSADGNVWIWNLDGTVRSKIDVGVATAGTRPRHQELFHHRIMPSRHGSKWQTCVRDASWHPNAPVLAATSWNGWGMCNGTVSLHSWNDGMDDDEGDPPLGTNYNECLEINEDFNEHARMSRGPKGCLHSKVVRPTSYGQDDADEDEDRDDLWNW